MRGGLAAGTPAQDGVRIDVRGAVGRLRLARLRRRVGEPDFAQTILAHHAVSAVDREPHELRRDSCKIDDRIGNVIVRGGRLGKLGVRQNCPFGTVDRVLDGNVFEPEAQHRLEHHVVVPDLQLVELEHLLELELNPNRCFLARGGHPHVSRLGGMLIGIVKTGTVDRVLWPARLFRDTVRGHCDVLNRIGDRLGREAPDLADVLGHAVTREAVHAPVVGLAEIQEVGGIVRVAGLPLADQDPHRVGPAGGGNVIQRSPEVHVVGGHAFARHPAEDHVARHISRAVFRCRTRGPSGLDVFTHHIEDRIGEHGLARLGEIELALGCSTRFLRPHAEEHAIAGGRAGAAVEGLAGRPLHDACAGAGRDDHRPATEGQHAQHGRLARTGRAVDQLDRVAGAEVHTGEDGVLGQQDVHRRTDEVVDGGGIGPQPSAVSSKVARHVDHRGRDAVPLAHLGGIRGILGAVGRAADNDQVGRVEGRDFRRVQRRPVAPLNVQLVPQRPHEILGLQVILDPIDVRIIRLRDPDDIGRLGRRTQQKPQQQHEGNDFRVHQVFLLPVVMGNGPTTVR